MDPLGDRRRGRRFEVVGQQWGSLEAFEPVRLVDVSAGGLRLVSRIPFAPQSAFRLRLRFDGDGVEDIELRARHVRPAGPAQPGLFVIGADFIDLSSRAVRRLTRDGGRHADRAAAAGYAG